MKAPTNDSFHERDQEYYLQTFKRFPQAIVRGKGARVWDAEGSEYIDLLAGIAVNNVGHCHPKVVKAVQDQAEKVMHISNFFVSKPQVDLSQRLVELSGLDRVFFSNSGAESVEGAIKIARKYAHSKGRGGEVISMEGSFHGRTLATIATGKKQMQNGFGPIPHGFKRVPFNDINAVKAAVSGDTAAVILEPIQGEGGINVAEKEYIRELRQVCDKADIVLIFDEIQCGVGRTGRWFAKEHFGVEPDIMTLAKGLGGGVPIGAILSNQKVSDAIDFGDHGTTFGGNPLVCAAALATVDAIHEENMLKQAEQTGAWLRDQFENMKDASIVRVKGKGLMIGVEFEFETKPLVMEMLEHRVIANATAGNILRLLPPLNISKEDLSEALKVIRTSIEKIKKYA